MIKKNILKYRHILFAMIPLFFIVVCTENPTEIEQNITCDHYTITITGFNKEAVSFSYTAISGTRFILPFHYFDNPPMDSSQLIEGLAITDANGLPVDTQCIRERIGPLENMVVVLPNNVAYPVTFNYHFNPPGGEFPGKREFVYINDSTIFLLGAYCFIIPQTGITLVELWRTVHPIRVDVNSSSNITIHGLPSSQVTCMNNYEILFLQISAGYKQLASGRGGNTDFIIVGDENSSEFMSIYDMNTILSDFSIILGDITSLYGPIESPYTIHLLRDNDISTAGLEGMYGYLSGTLDGWGLSAVEKFAHEVLHYYIGIRCGDYDDPWWKEAAATYLAIETLVRLCYTDQVYSLISFNNTFAYEHSASGNAKLNSGIKAESNNLSTMSHTNEDTLLERPLSDPWLRENLFYSGAEYLAYNRGYSVMAKLDLSIRTGSDNRYTLSHAMADLCKQFNGSAFSREDILQTLEKFGATDARDIFSVYVDTDSLIPDEQNLEIHDSIRALDSLWRIGQL